MMVRERAAFGLMVLFSASLAFAGQITFKNGDHLTGKVSSPAEGKLTIESPTVGTITVSVSDVASFTTDAPVKATLTNGTVVKAPITTEHNASTAPSAPHPVAMADIANVAPATLAKPWTGDVLIGATVQTGNTQSTQVNASADAMRRWENARLTLKGQYIFGRSHDRPTGKNSTISDYADASAKYDYFISKKWYAYGLLKGQHDAVADLNIRLTPNAGIGYQWHEGPIWNFSTEAGAGWTYEDYSPGGVNEYVSARLAYHYDRKLLTNLSFIHDLEYLPDVSDPSQFIINADAGLRADISKSLFTEFKVQWTHNSNPPAGSLEDDLRYLASLGWHF